MFTSCTCCCIKLCNYLSTYSIELGQIYVAKQRYDAIGSRSNRVLSFDRGEELEILNASAGGDWWEVSFW